MTPFDMLRVLAGLALLPYLVFLYAGRRASRPPQREHPGTGNGPRVLFLGDSLTHGRMSADYVAGLAERLGPKGYHLTNGGQNGDLVYTLRRRLDTLPLAESDAVVILIGTNDARAVDDPVAAQRGMAAKKLPQVPNFAFFQDNLNHLLEEVKSKAPKARIALLTLPPLGEDLTHPAADRVAEVNGALVQAAQHHQLHLLPFGRRLAAALPKGNRKAYTRGARGFWEMARAMVLFHVFKKTYTQIGQGLGYHLLCDGVHLNEKAGDILIDLISSWLEDTQQDKKSAAKAES